MILDFGLARTYGFETKKFNRQVKKNIAKLSKDFMFQLNESEVNEIMRCKKFTANGHPEIYHPLIEKSVLE